MPDPDQSSSSATDNVVVPAASIQMTLPRDHEATAQPRQEEPTVVPPPPPGNFMFWADMSESSSSMFPPGNNELIRTRRRSSNPPPAISSCRRRFRYLLRCICFPVVVLTTMVALLLFLIFIGLPFLLFLAGLLTVYYCCTSDPIPFRTLLRAMVGVEDWNGGAFDGANSGEPYSITKEDIRKGIIRRLCLGPMEWKSVVVESVGGDLSTLPRDHPGRVHWRNEATSVTCLVFSEPLGSTSSVGEERQETDSPSAAETLQREESLRAKIPKYLQHHEEEETKEKEEEEKEEEAEPKEPGKTEAKLSPVGDAPAVEPLHDLEEPSQPAAGDSPPDDASSVRDRGKVCDICLLEFETGEAVAWSPNPDCDHAYHEECITDWLLRKPTCPSCRQNFILLPSIRQLNDDQSSGILDALDDSDDSDSDSWENSSDINASETDIGDGLQPPVVSAESEGDIEMGTSGNGQPQ